ncbi:hypothetical protein Cgig2_017819 [Carnegiea gigantea]|uniref:Uncharacterized protein n=1 Tax=Carnegiea gigantea TaxID=171969 RepID=A0A9Q1KYW5_9CARY|nr:hypothetical protein Cgig2_017819 [Carnegiea gigantea]
MNVFNVRRRSNYEVTELTWENGQLAMHEVGGMFPPLPPRPLSSTSSSPPKPSWGGIGQAGDTLESLVHQATYCNTQSPNPIPNSAQNIKKVGSFVASSCGKWVKNSVPIQNAPPPPPPLGLAKKRSHLETDHSKPPNDHESASASANAAFCRDNNDTTMMTWASHESPRSCTRTKTTTDEDSACHGGSGNHEEEREAKGDTGRSYTTRKGRAAAVHNQSERLNQTDKASMLDEVIEYLKQLQAQVQMISNARFMPQIMMPTLGMQQHLQQMSLLARMGMGAGLGMGVGMLDTTSIGQNPMPPQTIPQLIHPAQVATSTSTFVPPGAFVLPQMIPQTQQANPVPGTSSSAPLQEPYAALLAQAMNSPRKKRYCFLLLSSDTHESNYALLQSMNMDLYNRIATLQRQQQQRTPPQPTSNPLHSNHHVHGG